MIFVHHVKKKRIICSSKKNFKKEFSISNYTISVFDFIGLWDQIKPLSKPHTMFVPPKSYLLHPC